MAEGGRPRADGGTAYPRPASPRGRRPRTRAAAAKEGGSPVGSPLRAQRGKRGGRGSSRPRRGGAGRTFQPQVLDLARPPLQLPEDAGAGAARGGGRLGGAVELGQQPAHQRRGAAGPAAPGTFLVLVLLFLLGQAVGAAARPAARAGLPGLHLPQPPGSPEFQARPVPQRGARGGGRAQGRQDAPPQAGVPRPAPLPPLPPPPRTARRGRGRRQAGRAGPLHLLTGGEGGPAPPRGGNPLSRSRSPGRPPGSVNPRARR